MNHLPLWEQILAWPLGILFFLGLWWVLELPGRNAPRYWRCTANHRHQTPLAATRCSAAQREG